MQVAAIPKEYNIARAWRDFSNFSTNHEPLTEQGITDTSHALLREWLLRPKMRLYISAINTPNPYDALIEASENDPVTLPSICIVYASDPCQIQIQARYEAHRKARNDQQKAQLLSPGFTGMVLDPVLQKLLHPEQYPGYSDPRHNLVLWARPSSSLRDLIHIVQQKLLTAVPSLYLRSIETSTTKHGQISG